MVVIGGGHAGIEAAYIAARMGMATSLLTMNLDQIGQMSCNPSIGGVGKGHMVRELDALGGAMGRLIDATGIHFRILNESRGVAVRGPRAQADKVKYRIAARSLLEHTPNLRLRQGTAAGLLWEEGTRGLKGVELLDGSILPCDAVVVTSGTFLNGRILIGEKRLEAGRAGEPASTHLAEQLRALGLRHRRLKTGTSPRLAKGSIDFTRLEEQPGDQPPRPFSFFSTGIPQPQVPCHIVHTTRETEAIVRENLPKSSLYGGHIEGVGPRYCPSIEDKFVKFPDKGRHQIFVEPESLETEEIYLAGLSTSMPPEVQLRMVRSLPGFEAAEILRPGYAIEYDSFDPLQLQRDLSVEGLEGVWFAGQINGTTGYEEAAGQGVLAGINAVRWLRVQEPIVLGREQAYMGVMVDDLVTKGTDEPYRMLTARAEHRLGLACDLADGRLLPVARAVGALSAGELAQVEARAQRRERLKAQCEEAWVTQTSPFGPIAAGAGIRLEAGLSLSELFRRQQIGTVEADACLAQLEGWDLQQSGWSPATERDLLLFDLRYAPYREREARLLEGQRAWDHVRIPSDLRVEHLQGISREVLEKLALHRPETLGQASRIPGITPAAVTILHLLIHRSHHSATQGENHP
ncbi:tRNA uridine-5-carboxymethylaminomethyl(34) synthesis enzyme MnmG [Geothrix sp. PMB-07]|uniref:tRNA uridine-5-carboxymethylaminomethyl(34) synthesis enzyme MnmG n=1 Tax=Geothrix sp. PMB-07 TaxID=3068640 RepID=UPI002740D3F7|nr:tRNA uridine-5-carboxymethylaminomethyl(34) synthesis enzyme MnmG [Geothrix sp. PMB-07]WLT33580.1 tRNA uridine-5-carboxymethylaminomethyl(34) synthesis enzyme MnmG [Geothrix sp. PMB-07]